ncbi:MAG TPA: hypothetical protein ENK57_23990 [Polyangiaceae bacterium]|nr:hypothetical protein [Polyangiaceae bacterium]
MRTVRTVDFPKPREEDFEDVHWALSAGKSLWDRGEKDEALKWVRRAANAAAERDADVRAVELFKVAADMASLVDARELVDAPVPEGETPTLGRDDVEPEQAPDAAKMVHHPRGNATSNVPPRRVHRYPKPQPRPTLRDGPHHLQPRPPHPRGSKADPDPSTRRRGPRDLSPKVPPSTRISERFGAFELPFDDREEDTFIRPETMLRRALMAIDPNYVRRTEYNDDGSGPDPAFVSPEVDEEITPQRTSAPHVPGWGWDDDEDAEDEGETAAVPLDERPEEEFDDLQAETARFRASDSKEEADASATPDEVAQAPPARKETPSHAAGPMPGGLLTLRVALLPIPEEGDIRIVFLSPEEEPPPGVATALLVPPSEEDAKLLAALYGETDAKL